MPIYVRTDIYEPVCDHLLESTGLSTLGIMTDADFLKFLNESVNDFLTYSQCKKKIVALQALAFTSEYDQPDFLERTTDALYNGTGMYHSYAFFVDASNPNTGIAPYGNPNSWYIDDGSVKNIRFTPAPSFTGDQVSIAGGAGLYGTFSQTSGVNDFDVTCNDTYPNGLLGTIQNCDTGAVYCEFTAPMFGTVSQMVPINGMNGNFALIGYVNTYQNVQSLDEYLPLVNPSYDLYIQFGILARIFAGDSEYKDETREKYCVMRFLEGVNICRAMMGLEPLASLSTRKR